MAFKLIWLIDGHVMYGRMSGDWTGETVREFDTAVIAMVEQAEAQAPQMHAIYDPHAVRNLAALKDYLLLQSSKHPNAGWTVMVGVESKEMKFVISTAIQLLKLRAHFVATLEDALAFLQKVDQTLPPLDRDAVWAKISTLDTNP